MAKENNTIKITDKFSKISITADITSSNIAIRLKSRTDNRT